MEAHRQRVRIRIAFEIEMDSTDSPGHIPSGLNLPNNEFILAGGRAWMALERVKGEETGDG